MCPSFPNQYWMRQAVFNCFQDTTLSSPFPRRKEGIYRFSNLRVMAFKGIQSQSRFVELTKRSISGWMTRSLKYHVYLLKLLIHRCLCRASTPDQQRLIYKWKTSHVMLPLFQHSSMDPSMIFCCLDMITAITSHLIPIQTPVLVVDQPVSP